jgi:hypothetical protein
VADPPGLAPPVNKPDVKPIEATVVLALLHVPPDMASANVVVAPEQIPVVPVIADGWGFTVSIAVTEQPAVEE